MTNTPTGDRRTALLPTRCPYTFQIMGEGTNLPCQTNPERYPLPDGWAGSGTLTFAMAGARASGKSLYIAVVVKLLEQLVENNGFVFEPADDPTREIYREQFEEPLFEQMGLPAPTSTGENEGAYQNQPLIFRIGTHLRTDANGQRVHQPIHVVIRDVAGEDFAQDHFPNMRERMRFFRFADEIIFMFDPVRVPEINNLLEGSIPSLPKLDTHDTEDPATVLSNLLSLIEPEDDPLIALMLAKFDTMQELAKVDQVDMYYGAEDKVNWQRVMNNFGAGFRRESGDVTQPYSLPNGELLHHEVLSLLRCLDAMAFLNRLNEPGRRLRYRCFAVSALGTPPETGSSVSRSGIAPFRCLDPFRYVLAQWGLLNGDRTDPGALG
ncbi:hypothetical protein JIM95_006590 [Corynebacterium sp. CCM 8835]|uniref:Uncharacterized protein n=1 Tax=Corynebacterium antarcticum TaxID=2800405 RepID=A0A9Q4CDQ0_9CORY|nr:hypothetical protein [Corynebacterium antarcticum]MCK7642255.1 hypothetical protein [Corynebacterium antarcticum]MCK7661060.1 hypothetical protein [Corynebacterium antarcticum]MCL0245808.1 hypothetical protein [Corynebacterium antarcticum]MCX7491736.1 hypothetical protein [Corynebacterium antarcticum]MCX7538217.1 hypothetical protein [Corynebacterium antarcticum]